MKHIYSSLTVLLLSILAVALNGQDDSPERNFIQNHSKITAEHFGGTLVDLDIQRLNHQTSLIPERQVWRSTLILDVDGTRKEVATIFVDFVPDDDRVLPIFTMENGKKTEIPDESTRDFLAKRAAHFLTYEAKLFNEPDAVNENGLNIRTFRLKNGETFRGHLLSRDGESVTIERLPIHSAMKMDEFSDADQKWLKSAPVKIAR